MGFKYAFQVFSTFAATYTQVYGFYDECQRKYGGAASNHTTSPTVNPAILNSTLFQRRIASPTSDRIKIASCKFSFIFHRKSSLIESCAKNRRVSGHETSRSTSS